MLASPLPQILLIHKHSQSGINNLNLGSLTEDFSSLQFGLYPLWRVAFSKGKNRSGTRYPVPVPYLKKMNVGMAETPWAAAVSWHSSTSTYEQNLQSETLLPAGIRIRIYSESADSYQILPSTAIVLVGTVPEGSVHKMMKEAHNI